MADYYAKVVQYPGYQYIEAPLTVGKHTDGELDRVNKAMEVHNPYRYLFGLFNSVDDGIGTTVVNDVTGMVNTYLPSHSFLKADKRSTPDLPDGFRPLSDKASPSANGYICAVSISNSHVKVFVGQRYIFSRMFNMIGMGNKYTNITATATMFTNDSTEFIRNCDFIFSTVDMIIEKTGFDTQKITDVVNLFTGNG